MEEADRKEGVHRIKHACIEMNQLMENLLEWAKVQTGRVRIAPVEFDLYTMAEEMISIIKTATEKKQLTIKQSLDCRALVKADRNMVGTVMRNLLYNAIKFSPRGSEIQITCNAGIRENDLEFHQVIVEDHGNGMEPRQVDRLFQLDRTETTRGTENEKGTGLGLIICKDFLELNGGKISVESEKGKGSRFIFTLPSCNGDYPR
jgi:signal transduction histidine kinase